MDDTERILQAIAGLDDKFTGRLQEVEETVCRAIHRQNTHTKSIRALEHTQQKQEAALDEIRQRLEELTRSGSKALIRHDGNKAVLKKEVVYPAFEKEFGISSRKLMRLLDQNGLIVSTERYRNPTVYDPETKKIFRAVVVYVPVTPNH